MSYQVFWKDPQKLLSVDLQGRLTLADLEQINRTIVNQLGDEATNPTRSIDLLIDLTDLTSAPQSLKYLCNSQPYVLRKDLRLIIVAGCNRFFHLMMLHAFHAGESSLRFADTVEQAIELAHIH